MSVDIGLIQCCRQTYELTKARFDEEKEYKRRKLDLEEREMLFKEAKAGLISKMTFDRQYARFWGGHKSAHHRKSPSPSSESGRGSVDWDIEQLDEDMANSDGLDLDGI